MLFSQNHYLKRSYTSHCKEQLHRWYVGILEMIHILFILQILHFTYQQIFYFVYNRIKLFLLGTTLSNISFSIENILLVLLSITFIDIVIGVPHQYLIIMFTFQLSIWQINLAIILRKKNIF
jgi:hypothetical protein